MTINQFCADSLEKKQSSRNNEGSTRLHCTVSHEANEMHARGQAQSNGLAILVQTPQVYPTSSTVRPRASPLTHARRLITLDRSGDHRKTLEADLPLLHYSAGITSTGDCFCSSYSMSWIIEGPVVLDSYIDETMTYERVIS